MTQCDIVIYISKYKVNYILITNILKNFNPEHLLIHIGI